MSLEQKIEELTGTVASLIAALERTATNQERLLLGQEKAIEAVKAGNPATTTRGRKPKATDTQNTSVEPAATESGAGDAESASDEPKKPAAVAAAEAEKLTFAVAAKKWLDKAEKGSDEYKSRGGKIMGILANFGAGKMSELAEADEAKAMFYLKRTVKGLPVNFDAEYDFGGPVDQAEPEPSAAASDDTDSDDDMFG